MKQQIENPKRGSVEAILQVLEQVGPLQFTRGELEASLTEIQALRETDMDRKDTPQ